MSNIKTLYGTLKGQGYNDIGTEEEFKNWIGGEGNVKKLHSTLAGKGYDDIGSEEEFTSWLNDSKASSNSNSNDVLNIIDISTDEQLPTLLGATIGASLPYNQEVKAPDVNSRYVASPGSALAPSADNNLMSDNRRDMFLNSTEAQKRQNKAQVGTLYQEISNELTGIEDEAKTKEVEYAKENPLKFALSVATSDNTSKRFIDQKKVNNLSSAKKMLDESMSIIDEANRKGNTNFFAGAGRGFANKAFDLDTWSMGMAQLTDAVALKSAAEKADKGEQLTDDEEKLLTAAAVNMATQAYFSSDIGRGYKAGQVTAESIPFMLEFVVNPASTAGKGFANSVLKYGLRKFGKSAMQSAGGKALRIGSRAVGDLGGAAIMSATTGIGHVAADAITRQTGQINYGLDENLKAEYSGRDEGEGIGTSVLKAFGANTIENYSEMFGNYFGPLVDGIMKYTGANKIGAKFFGNLFKGTKSSKLLEGVKNFERSAQWHGPIGEYAEEQVGNILNALTVGDTQWSDISDLDQQIDTFLGVSLMGGFFSGIKSVSYLNQARKNLTNREGQVDITPEPVTPYQENKNLTVLARQFDLTCSNPEEGQQIREMIDGMDMNERKEYLAGYLQASNNPEQKRAVLAYVAGVTHYEAMISGIQKDIADTIDDTNQEIIDNSNQAVGNVISARMEDGSEQGLPVNIVSGLYEDTNDYVIVSYQDIDEAGNVTMKREQVAKKRILPESISSVPLDEVLSTNAEAVTSTLSQQAAEQLSFSPDIPEPQPGMQFELDGKLLEVAQITPDAIVCMEFDEKGNPVQAVPISVHDYKEAYQSIIDAQDTENLPPLSKTDNMIGNNVENARGQVGEQNTLSYIEQIPKDEQGNIIFEQAAPEITINALNEIYDTQEELRSAVEATVVSNQKKRDKLSTPKPTGDINKDILNKQKSKAEIADLTAKIDYWNNVLSAIPEPIIPERTLSFNERLNALQNDVVSVRDQILAGIASGNFKFNWRGKKNTPGLGKELGLINSEADRRSYINLLSNDGYTVEQLAHSLWEANGERIDDAEIRDEIIDVLSSVRSRTDALNALEKSLVLDEEQYYQDQQESYEAEQELLRQEDEYIKEISSQLYDEAIDKMINIALEKGITRSELDNLFTVIDIINVLEQFENGQRQEQTSNQGRSRSEIQTSERNTDSSQPVERRIEESDRSSEDRGTESPNTSGREDELNTLTPELIKNEVEGLRLLSGTNDEVHLAFTNAEFLDLLDKYSVEYEDGGLALNTNEGNIIINISDSDNINDILRSEAHEIFHTFVREYIPISDLEDVANIIGVEKLNELAPGYENNSNVTKVNELIACVGAALQYKGKLIPFLEGKITAKDLSDWIKEKIRLYPLDILPLVDNILYNIENKNNERKENRSQTQTLHEGDGETNIQSIRRRSSSRQRLESQAEAISQITGEEKENVKLELFERGFGVETNPSEAQKEAGNYKKGHVKIQGFDITIEQPKGSIRSGVDESGNEWSVTMNNTYGYFKRTKGKDGDHIDVFVGDNPDSRNIFVVDQVNSDNSFDEHKVMLGFDTIEEARESYLKNYSPGWSGLGNITGVELEAFRKWLDSDTRRIKPFSEYQQIQNVPHVEEKPSYGASNTIISSEKYEELKRKMREKLNNLNVGFDPELFTMGAQMAMYHIEAGARKFEDFATRMINDLGDGVIPYLKSFYEGSRHAPGMEVYSSEMDSNSLVVDFNIDKLNSDFNHETETIRETFESTADVVIAEAAVRIEQSTPKKRKSAVRKQSEIGNLFADIDETIEKIDVELNKINKNLALLGHYEATSDAEIGEKIVDVNNNIISKLDIENNDFLRNHIIFANIPKNNENGTISNGLREDSPRVDDREHSGRYTGNVKEQSTKGIPGRRSNESDQSGEQVNPGRNDADRSGRSGDVQNSDAIRYERDGEKSGRTGRGNNEPGENSSNRGIPGNNTLLNQNNFRIVDVNNIVPKGEIAKIKANIKAISLLKELEKEDREATAQEKETLSQYSGWGGLAEVLNKNRKFNENWRNKYQKYHEEVINLLTPEEYTNAVNSTINAHYTNGGVVSQMWKLAERLGFKGGTILEPAIGTGNFFGLIPESLLSRSALRAYELDSITGRIASKLYPDASVKVTGYENSTDRNIDLIITNVPFAQNAPYDKGNKDLSNFSLHNYFIAKGIKQLAPNGIGLFITSASSMDSASSSKFRQWVTTEGNADLIGAIRLPNTAFSENAGTSVTTDILVFKKRDSENASIYAQPFRYTVPVKDTVKKDGTTTQIDINEYFSENSDMMLGDLYLAHEVGSGGLYSGDDVTLLAPKGQNLIEDMSKAIEKFPENISDLDNIPVNIKVESEEKDGTVVEKDGVIYEVNNGELVKPDWASQTLNNTKKKKVTKEKVAKHYLKIKDLARNLVDAERVDLDSIESLRSDLNKEYDSFVKEYGRMNNNLKTKFLMDADIDYNIVFALEKVNKRVTIDEEGKTKQLIEVEKSDIFSKRILYPVQEPSTAGSLSDAINVSIAYRGRLDLDYISKLTNQSTDAVQENLLNEGLAFVNPENGLIEDKDTYLSGFVRTKYNQAVEAAENNPEFETNVKALKAVVPADIPSSQIKIRLGSPFIDGSIIEAFASDLFKVQSQIIYSPQLGKWVVNIISGNWSAENRTQFGSNGFSAMDLLEKGLNLKQPEVFDTSYNGSSKVRVKNLEKTAAAQSAALTIADEFVNYVYGNEQAMSGIERKYNELYNDYVEKNYSVPAVKHYPNASLDISLRRHQKAAVSRGLRDSLLLAHQVGTGKTFTMQTIAMEMRRLGIAKKPMIVVQNATLEQFVLSFKQLYPGANLLAPTKRMMDTKNRQRLFSLIAYGDYDAVIIPQSFVDMIPDDPNRQKVYINEQISELEAVLADMKEEDNTGLYREFENALSNLNDQLTNIDTPKVKNIAKKQLSIEKRINKQADRRTDNVLTFEKMGIDAILVDEAHAYKKLGFFTKMSRIKGIDTGRSKRAFGMFMKTQFIEERTGGKNVIFATGTPITNTMAEVWTMMKFISPDILEKYNISTFDEFATTFGSVEPSLEFTATGSFKIVERFKSYINAPELLTAFRSKTDVVLTEDIPEFKKGNTIPKLKNNAFTQVIIPQSEGLITVMEELKDELKRWEELSGREKKQKSYVPLVIFNRAKQAAIDLRLIDPSALDDPGSKTNKVVSEVKRIYDQSKYYKGTQLIFSDMYQSPESLPGKRFNLYQDIRDKLIELGVDPTEIAIINDFEGAKREILFDQVNNGNVRIVLGSTERMGVGVNIQERLAALHHVDAPPRPMDFEQRNGRILRQGNLHAEMNVPVEVVTYGVEKTLDAIAYQRLAIKQKFINQMMKGDDLGREIADSAEEDSPTDMTFDQMMSTLSGSQYAMLHVQRSYELKKLETAERNYYRRQIELNQLIKSDIQNVEFLNERIKNLESAKKLVEKYFPDDKINSISINGKAYTEKLATTIDEVFTKYIKGYAKERSIKGAVESIQIRINNYPISVYVNLNNLITNDLNYTLNMGDYIFSGKVSSGQGFLTSLRSRFINIDKDVEDNRIALKHIEGKLPVYKAELKKPFDKADKLESLRKEVEDLEDKMKDETDKTPRSLPNDTGDNRFRFIGEVGASNLDNANEATVMLDNLSVARDFESTRKSKKTIKLATGWERGADNKWRYELDDSIIAISDTGEFSELRNSTPGILSDYINDDDLFKAYPKLRKTKLLRGVYPFNQIAGFYNADDNILFINSNLTNEVFKRTLLHEVQHAIQYIEGFASGGSRNTFKDKSGNTLSRLREIYSLITEIEKEIGLDKYVSMLYEQEVTGTELSRLANEYRRLSNKSSELNKLLKEREILNERILDEANNYDRYLFISGEVEARNVESRLNMSTEERLNSLASGTEDVDRKDQIFIYDSILSESSYNTEIANLSKQLNTPVKIIYNLNDIAINETKKRNSKGWYDPNTGEVVVVLPNATGVGDIQATILHEVVAHKGLSDMLGRDNFNELCKKVFNSLPENTQKELLEKYKSETVAGDEYMASIAENGIDASLWTKIKGFIRNAFRSVGVNLKMKDADIKYLLWKSKNRLQSGDSIFDVSKKVSSDKSVKEALRMRDVPSIVREYESSLKTQKYKAQEAYQDSMLALKKLQDLTVEYSGKKLEGYENAYIAENHMSSKGEAESESYLKNYFKPLINAISSLVTKEVSYNDVVYYVFAKHGLERNVKFAERDAQRWFDDSSKELTKLLEAGVVSPEEYEKHIERLKQKQEDLYLKNLENDYSGLSSLMTEITGKEEGDYTAFAQKLVDDFEEKRPKETTELWDRINAATKQTLKKSFESGLMSKSNYDKVKRMFEYYIPLRGWKEETAGDVFEYFNSEVSPVNSPVKSANGRMSLADDPFATIGNMAESTILLGNRNLMKQNFLNMVINRPNELTTLKNMWYKNVGTEEKPIWEESFPDIKPNATPDEIAMEIEEHEQLMNELKKEGRATQKTNKLNVGMHINRRQANEHMVIVKRNGKEYVIYINGNPRAAQALNGLTNPFSNKKTILDYIDRANRQLAANFTTRNPAFVLSNLSRDLIFAHSAVAVKENPEYVAKFSSNVPKSIAAVRRGIFGKGKSNAEIDKYFKEFIENGGETGYTALHNVDEYKKMIKRDLAKAQQKVDYLKAVHVSAQFFSNMNRWAEDVSRFNTYLTSRQMGRSILDSVHDAKEVTVNFNKKGSGYKTGGFFGVTAGLTRNLFLFFNAGVQSLMNFGRLAIKNPTGFMQMVGGFTWAGFAIPAFNVIAMSLYGDDDDKDAYNNLPEWVRRNNLCLFAPWTENKFITIPLPIELRAFYGIGELCYQASVGNMKHENAIIEAANQLTELLPVNPLGQNGDIISTITPDIAKPFVQIVRNKDFFGKPVYRENTFNEGMPEWTKVYSGTSPWMVKTSEILNKLGGGDKYTKSKIDVLDINPAKIEHVFENYFGGMAKTINQTGKTLTAGVESIINGELSEDLVVRNMPIINRFINEIDDRNAFTKVNRDYFHYYDEYKKTEQSFNGYKKELKGLNAFDFSKKLGELYRSPEFKRFHIFNIHKRQIQELQILERSLPESSGKEKESIKNSINKIKKGLVAKLDKIED